MSDPGYWMYETSGVLRPAIVAYLEGGPMTPEHITAMRAYLRQWIAADRWLGMDQEITALRRDVDGLTTRRAIAYWLRRAQEQGIDPL